MLVIKVEDATVPECALDRIWRTGARELDRMVREVPAVEFG